MKIGKKDLLLVIDMQNVYLPEEDWACPRITTCIPYIQSLLSVFPQEQVIFTRFLAPKEPIGIWKKYNELNATINKNDWANEYVAELRPFLTKENLYTKSTYSCSSNPLLMKRIQESDYIYVTGVVAECCVLSTIFTLIDMGKKVYYLQQGIAGENSDKERQVINLLQGLSPLHIEFL